MTDNTLPLNPEDRLHQTLNTGSRIEYLHDSGIRLVFDFITPTSKGVDAWCEIRWQGDTPQPYVITYGRRDLMGSTTSDSLTKQALGALRKHHRVDPDVMREAITVACYQVIQIQLEGVEPLVLSQVPAKKQRWLLKPLVEHGVNHTRVIAAGGSGKSVFALAVAYTVATGSKRLFKQAPTVTGPVIYLDWETSADVHANRLEALCKGMGLDDPGDQLLYLPMPQALARSAHWVAHTVAETGTAMIVVDSNIRARGTPSTYTSAEATSTQLFEALRQIGVPAFIVDHKSDEKIRKNQRGGYGSITNQNNIRVEWEVAGMSKIRSADRLFEQVEVRYAWEKGNNSAAQEDIAYRIAFQNERVDGDERLTSIEFNRIAPSTVQLFGKHLDPVSQVDRAWSVLANQTEPMPLADLAEVLGVSARSLSTQMARDARFENVAPRGRPGLWRAGTGDEGDALPAPF